MTPVRLAGLCAALMLVAACESSAGGSTVTPVPTASAVVATTVTEAPEPTAPSTEAPVAPPTTPVEAAAVVAPAPDRPDYATVADEVATTDTSLGGISWLVTSRVPVAWIEEGFPSFSFMWPRSWIELYAVAPEGVEIFEVASGYVGLGVGGGVDYAGRMAAPAVRQWWPQFWWDLVPEAVWFSPDGESWEPRLEGPIEPGVVTWRDPYVLAELKGRFVLVGRAGAQIEVRDVLYDGEGNVVEDAEGNAVVLVEGEDPGDLFDGSGNPVTLEEILEGGGSVESDSEVVDPGRPMAWVSDDLVTWQRVVASFDKPAMITDLNAVVATELGWFMFGVRRTDTADPLERRVAEWVAWVSPDGTVWEEFPIGELLDDPQVCRPTQSSNCIRMKGEPAPGGAVAVYAYEWDPYSSDIRQHTWDLLIGLPTN
jgi:hypothetical protein